MINNTIISSSHLRIAIVTETFPPEVNGVAMTLGRIVKGLLQLGHLVQLVRPRQSGDGTAQIVDGVEVILSPGMQIPTYKDLRLGFPIKGHLCKVWSECRPDVVHVVTEGPLGWSAVAAARQLQLPVTSSFHTNFHQYSQHYGIGLFKVFIGNYLRKLHNMTYATMVPTRTMMQELKSLDYNHVTLLSRGVATDLFSPARRSEALRTHWGAKPEDLVVLHVGRLAKEKNVGLVIASFQAIRLQVPTAKLVFVGDGPLRNQIEKSCPEAVFAGIRKGDDLAAHYASGDLFLFPSLTETFGNVVPEALASGLAVLSYACAAAGELITPEENGVLVPPGEEGEFIDAAVDLATHQQKLLEIRQLAAPSVSHLGWDAVYGAFAEILFGAIEQHRCHYPIKSRTMMTKALSPTNA